MDEPATPAWSDEVHAWLAVAPQLVLTGNVGDRHLFPLDGDHHRSLVTTIEVLVQRLRSSGYEAVACWNPVRGLYAGWEKATGVIEGAVGESAWNTRDLTESYRLDTLVTAVSQARELRMALIVEDAPRMASAMTDQDLHRTFVVARHQALHAPRMRVDSDARDGLYNTVLWLVNSEAELPHWFVGAGPVRVVSVPRPGRDEREELCTTRLPLLDGFASLDAAGRSALVRRFTDFTDGLTLTEVATAVQVAVDQGIPAGQAEEAVRFIRSASRSSLWHGSGLRQRIGRANDDLNQAVLGQQRAVRKIVDVLARAAIGLAGAYSDSHPTRPRGVLFLAGPTGVGKTEAAKEITRILFGRNDSMVRFDMSEFSAEHSEARLLGAPPGYIGHNAGGELTNAVRRRPFCLLLFDEIDKAHPRILDKFLQILEDGRLTDASGSTVYFTETFIVFTSNLGVSASQWRPTVRAEASYRDVEAAVRATIRQKFLDINRPELLNRIGDNIVAFDHIKPDVAAEILRASLDRISRRVERSTGSVVTFAPGVISSLADLVQQGDRLAYGGRAVGALLESRVLNPLARRLLELGEPARWTVAGISEDDEGMQILLEPHQ